MIKEDVWTLHFTAVSLQTFSRHLLTLLCTFSSVAFIFIRLSLSHTCTCTCTCSFHHELPSEAFASPLHIPDEESMRADYTPPESPVPAIFDLTSIPINDNTPLPPIDEPV
jgi:hypothetical protein